MQNIMERSNVSFRKLWMGNEDEEEGLIDKDIVISYCPDIQNSFCLSDNMYENTKKWRISNMKKYVSLNK